jgi:hypothetical protein
MLLDRIFNYAATLLKTGKEAEVLQWAALAEPVFPAPERWQEIIYGAVNNRLVKEAKSGRFAQARGFLAGAASKLSAENYRRIEVMLTDAELFGMVTAIKTLKDAGDALAAVEAAAALVDGPRLKELRVFAVIKKAGFLAKEEGLNAAIAYTEAARDEYGGDSRLDAQIRTLKDNRLAELHNSFAAAYNRREFESAAGILREALEEFPGNPRLISDRDMLEKVPARR